MKKFFELIGIILLIIILVVIEVFLATFLWNYVAVDIFELPALNPLHMFGLMILLNILIPHSSHMTKD